MYKDKEVNKNVKYILFINVWRKIVFEGEALRCKIGLTFY